MRHLFITLAVCSLCFIGCAMEGHGGYSIQQKNHPSYGGLYFVHASSATEPIYNGQTISAPWSRGGVLLRYIPAFETEGYIATVDWFRAGKFIQRSNAPSDLWLGNDGGGSVDMKVIVTWVSKAGCQFLREDEYTFVLNLYADTSCR